MILDIIKTWYQKGKVYSFLIQKDDIKYECVGKILYIKDGKHEIVFNFCDGRVIDSIIVNNKEIVKMKGYNK